jgi:hypothetical protein
MPFKERRPRMKLPKNLGMLLLAIWLILTGLAGFVSLGSLGIILNLLAIAAGILLLMRR